MAKIKKEVKSKKQPNLYAMLYVCSYYDTGSGPPYWIWELILFHDGLDFLSCGSLVSSLRSDSEGAAIRGGEYYANLLNIEIMQRCIPLKTRKNKRRTGRNRGQ